MERAQGCRKWDIESHEFIDLCTGHGSLILGHGHPAILKALHTAADKYTHPSAPTPYEVRWAELVTTIVPCAEMVRFQLSGTEATMLAMRIARAHTGRNIIVKLRDHFHGWHDYAMIEYVPPYEIPGSAGVPPCVAGAMPDRAHPRSGRHGGGAGAARRRRGHPGGRRPGGRGGPHAPWVLAGAPGADPKVWDDSHLRRGHHRVPDGRPAGLRSTSA